LYTLTSCSLPFIDISFFFNDPASTLHYTLSLHDALPIFILTGEYLDPISLMNIVYSKVQYPTGYNTFLYPDIIYLFIHADNTTRSEEHTSELQSRFDLVCRLLLEKKK